MKLKIFLKVILFFLIFFVLQFAIGRLLRGDVRSNTRVMMHELHSIDNLDTLFVGASHVYRSVQPDLIDKDLGTHSFVAASANQPLEGSFAIIKEAKLYHPELKNIYVDIDYNLCFNSDDDNVNLKSIYSVSKYLKNSKIKAEYLFSSTPVKFYLNNILEIGKEKITLNPTKNLRTIKAYINGDYWRYIYPIDKKNNEEYMGRGFIAAKKTRKQMLYIASKHPYFEEEAVSEQWIETIFNIIDFCKQEDINLSFISVPESNYFILGTQNYDDFRAFMLNLLNESGCVYYDFNMMKEDLLPLEMADYYDDDHLNVSGSDKFCKAFTNVILTDKQNENHFGIQNSKEKQEHFYGNYCYHNMQDLKLLQQKTIYGFYYEESDDKKCFTLHNINNLPEDCTVYYDYLFEDKNGNVSVLGEKLTDSSFVYPEKSIGKAIIKCYINQDFFTEITHPVYTVWLK
ncbi:MAG: hypothetical protein MJ188_01960 [Treponema sp.]|nr:hypothetical protein [Treponema sp.]